MPFSAGFNFRGSSGYATDGAGETYVLADSYPTVRGGFTFGWTTASVQLTDRDNTLDRRLAGINYVVFGVSAPGTFRVDLPNAGTYTVRLAMGDKGFGHTGNSVVIKDGATALLTIGPHNIVDAHYWDAGDADYPAADWPGSNSASGSLSFTGTALNLVLDTTLDAATLAHFSVSEVVTTGRRFFLVPS